MLKIASFILALCSIVWLVQSCDNSPIAKEISNESVSETSQNEVLSPKCPNEMTFCGEKIVFDNFDLKERLEKELIINTYYHSSTIQILRKSGRFFPEMESALREMNLPEDLKYVCVIESALSQATSPTGAKGFWQFMPETAKEFGLEVSPTVDERLDVAKSTQAAGLYFKRAKEVFGSWISASASYNCGIRGLSEQMENQQQSSFFNLYLNEETSRYVFRILALKLIMEAPDDYGYGPDEYKYQPIECNEIKVEQNIGDLAVWAKEHGTNLRILKVLNPWLIRNQLITNGKSYSIKLPK